MKREGRPVYTAGAAGGSADWSAEVFFLDDPLTETMLVVADDGAVFVGISCESRSTPGAVLRTRDAGKTWERLIPDPPADGEKVLDAAMGTLTLDRSCGRLFATSMFDPTCDIDTRWAEKISRLLRRDQSWSDTLAWSDDGGDTWRVVRGQFKDGGDWGKTFLGPPATPASRAKLESAGYPNVIYHCTGATFSETSYCWKSLDGGVTFSLTARPVFSNYMGRTPLPYGGEPDVPAGSPYEDERHTISGIGVVTGDGSVHIPANLCGFARLYVSRDEGDSWEAWPLPFAHVRSRQTHGEITGFVDPPNGGRPLLPQQPFHAVFGSTAIASLWSQQLAVDRDENFYLCWVDALDDLPYLAVSRDRGRTWSDPVPVAASGVDVACIAAIAVGEAGQVAIAYYGSRDSGWSYDGFVAVTRQGLDQQPHFHTTQTSPDSPIQPNRLSEPVEYVGVDFAPDDSVWASFARDTHTIDRASAERQADGNFQYSGDRFRGVVVHMSPRPPEDAAPEVTE